jgi:hypothetical protein
LRLNWPRQPLAGRQLSPHSGRPAPLSNANHIGHAIGSSPVIFRCDVVMLRRDTQSAPWSGSARRARAKLGERYPAEPRGDGGDAAKLCGVRDPLGVPLIGRLPSGNWPRRSIRDELAAEFEQSRTPRLTLAAAPGSTPPRARRPASRIRAELASGGSSASLVAIRVRRPLRREHERDRGRGKRGARGRGDGSALVSPDNAGSVAWTTRR